MRYACICHKIQDLKEILCVNNSLKKLCVLTALGGHCSYQVRVV